MQSPYGESKRENPIPLALGHIIPLEETSVLREVDDKSRQDVKEAVAQLNIVAATSAEGGVGSEIRACVECIYTVLEIFGFASRTRKNDLPGSNILRTRVIASFEETLKHWTAGAAACGSDGWMKFAKYKLAAFFHSHTDQAGGALNALPPVPWSLTTQFKDLPAKLCCGIAGRFMISNLIGKPGKPAPYRDEFLATVLQIKKGCPRPNEAMLAAEVKKTVAALVSVRPSPPPVMALRDWADVPAECPMNLQLQLTRATVIDQLRRTVREVMKDAEYTPLDRMKPYFPSTRATFTHSVNEGGQYEAIRTLADNLGLVLDNKSSVSFKEEKSNKNLDNESRTSQHRYNVDLTDLELRFGELFALASESAMIEPAFVKPVALAESLKVRIITKGPPATGFVLKPLQKFLWRTLSRQKVFRLTGEPVTPVNLQESLGARLPADEGYLSGDYSAATNELAPWVSEAIANEIADCLKLSLNERTLFIRALTQHIFIGEDGSHMPQMWGQLMGSVVSFPVLCIANAALCRWAMECSTFKNIPLQASGIMINGDDVVFRCTVVGLRLWKQITSFCGLTPSLGKYFYSREFAQINSANFIRLQDPTFYKHPDARPDTPPTPLYFKQSKYINLGLLFGLKRSGEVSTNTIADDKDGGTLGVRHRELLSVAPPELHEKLHKIFLLHHNKLLKSIHVPWYVPEHWGGVGLATVWTSEELKSIELDDVSSFLPYFGPSKVDLRVAARIQEQPEKYPVSKPPADVDWDTHRIAMQRMPCALSYGVRTTADAERYSRVYASLIVDAMFTGKELRKQTDKKKKKKNGPDRSVRVLRQNERSWRKALQHSNLPKPLSRATLLLTKPPEPFIPFNVTSIFPNALFTEATFGSGIDYPVVDPGVPPNYHCVKFEDDLAASELAAKLLRIHQAEMLYG
jgi:hypothetical protein